MSEIRAADVYCRQRSIELWSRDELHRKMCPCAPMFMFVWTSSFFGRSTNYSRKSWAPFPCWAVKLSQLYTSYWSQHERGSPTFTVAVADARFMRRHGMLEGAPKVKRKRLRWGWRTTTTESCKKRCNNNVSYEFLCTRTTYGYI